MEQGGRLAQGAAVCLQPFPGKGVKGVSVVTVQGPGRQRRLSAASSSEQCGDNW